MECEECRGLQLMYRVGSEVFRGWGGSKMKYEVSALPHFPVSRRAHALHIDI